MTNTPDTETEVCTDIKRRQEFGIAKYGTTVAQNPLDLRQWLQHAYEEKLDDAVYMKRAIQELDRIIDAGVANSIDIDKIMNQVQKTLGERMAHFDIGSVMNSRS